jgi:hypothetical protein
MTRPIHRYRRSHRYRRRGYTLAIFALLLVCLMALGALVIDLGLARVTQQQMQTAANSAALEGLRGRDQLDETARRQASSDMARFVFDDDFDLSSDNRNYGAGPRLELTGGLPLSPEFSASQLLTTPEPPVYDPVLALNEGDAIDGDMLARDYVDGPGITHEELPDYSRDDLVPPADIPNAFLVRLRRTNEIPAEGISTTGGTIPYLFGRGSLLHLDLRGRGIAVRATAIAHQRRAKSVGRSAPSHELPGALAIALIRSAWEHPLLDSAIAASNARLTIESSGAITLDDASDPMDIPLSAGQVIEESGSGAPLAIGIESVIAEPQVGADAFVASLFDAVPGDPSFGYVAIVPDAINPSTMQPTLIANRIIGFGWAEIRQDPSDSLNQLRVAKRENRIGYANASVTLVSVQSSSSIGDLDSSQIDELFDQHEGIDTPLLAPALVR